MGYLGFCFLGVLGVAFFWMAPSLHTSLIHDTPCPHCFGLYILGGLSTHIKNAHPPVNLISQVSQIVSFLQVSSLLVVFLGFIHFASWGWFQAKSNSILGFFEFRSVCLCLFRKIFQTIQNKVKQTFRFPFDQIAWNSTNELTWFIFLLLPCWCLCYIRRGCSNHR